MITEQQQEQASLYVLGALDADDERAFEAVMLESIELRELVRSLRNAASLLATSTHQVPLPPGLKAKVLQLIDEKISAGVKPQRKNPLMQIPGFSHAEANDPKGWKQLPIPGAWIKLLSIQRDRGYAVLLGRLEPGVKYPAHPHPGPEELFILTGDLQIGELNLKAGDFHHSDSGTSHGINYTLEGCTLLAVLPSDHELARFALA